MRSGGRRVWHCRIAKGRRRWGNGESGRFRGRPLRKGCRRGWGYSLHTAAGAYTRQAGSTTHRANNSNVEDRVVG